MFYSCQDILITLRFYIFPTSALYCKIALCVVTLLSIIQYGLLIAAKRDSSMASCFIPVTRCYRLRSITPSVTQSRSPFSLVQRPEENWLMLSRWIGTPQNSFTKKMTKKSRPPKETAACIVFEKRFSGKTLRKGRDFMRLWTSI
jgi:hypothetical protein